MIDFALTSEQIQMQRMAHEFAEKEIRPAEIELDRWPDPEDVFKSDLFWGVLKKAYEVDLHRTMIPEAYGGLSTGANTEILTELVVLEELAWGGVGLALNISVCPFVGVMVSFLGQMGPLFGGQGISETVIDEFVRPFCADKEARYVGSWGATEPECSSDLGLYMANPDPKYVFKTTARKVGNKYILNGSKSAFPTNGTIATQYVIHATIDASRGVGGQGIFVVPADLPGVSKGKPFNKIGMRAHNQGEIFLDNVEVPEEYLLMGPLPPEQGDFMADFGPLLLSFSNPSVGIMCVGMARAAYEIALDYAKQRVQGGVPIIKHEIIGLRLLDMYIAIEAARSFIYKSVWENSNRFPPNAALGIACKVFPPRMAQKVTMDAVEVMGGYGLSKEHMLEKLLRDAQPMIPCDLPVDVLAYVASQKL